MKVKRYPGSLIVSYVLMVSVFLAFLPALSLPCVLFLHPALGRAYIDHIHATHA